MDRKAALVTIQAKLQISNEELQISNEDFLKQLGMYSLAAAYNLPKTQIYSKQSFINTEGLTNERDY